MTFRTHRSTRARALSEGDASSAGAVLPFSVHRAASGHLPITAGTSSRTLPQRCQPVALTPSCPERISPATQWGVRLPGRSSVRPVTRRRALCVGAVTLLLLTGCSASPSPEPAPPSTIEVELAIDVALNPDGSVSVSAQTNLPDGTDLGGTVVALGDFMAQDSQVVENGAAEFGPFSDGGAPLPAGTYDVSVTMPIARNQPDAVKAIIGDAGENLTGPLVSVHDLTGDAVVSVSESLTVS